MNWPDPANVDWRDLLVEAVVIVVILLAGIGAGVVIFFTWIGAAG